MGPPDSEMIQTKCLAPMHGVSALPQALLGIYTYTHARLI